MPCWETAGQQLSLIRDSDLILYTDANISGTDLERLHFRNIFIKHYQTPGKEAGATQAVIDGFGSKGHQEKWFDGYDWVVRVNPDVLIMNDAWLLEMMANPSVDAILADCFGLIHTDFFAVRPHVIDAKLAEGCSPSSPKYGKVNAEVHFTCITSPIISSGRYVWVPQKHHGSVTCFCQGSVHQTSQAFRNVDTFRIPVAGFIWQCSFQNTPNDGRPSTSRDDASQRWYQDIFKGLHGRRPSKML